MAEKITMASSSYSILSTNLEETQWVLQISELLQRNEFHTAFESPISIFQVPDSIRNDSPEAFTPRSVALGPFHHFHPQLLNLELYKLGRAKKVKDQIQLAEFHQLISDKLKPLELKIRACFKKYLEVGCEALAWIMLIDGLFLIHLLQIFAEVEVKCSLQRHELPLPELDAEHQQMYLNPKANSMARNEIVSDTLMLENQIPFCVLKEILAGTQIVNDLPLLLYKFCVLVSPFGLPSQINSRTFLDLPQTFQKSHHLLHFLYLLILNQGEMGDDGMDYMGPASPNLLGLCFNVITSVMQTNIVELLQQFSELIQYLFEIFKALIWPSSLEDSFPMIPSASKLKKVGVKFQPKYSLQGIIFNKREAALDLPAITLDSTSHVILRNLVAFEVVAKLNPPCFSQYAAMVNGLIATANDVRILKEANIIINNLESDEEVVELFNGFTKFASKSDSSEIGSPKSTYMVNMVEIIEEVNKYYESKWKIKVRDDEDGGVKFVGGQESEIFIMLELLRRFAEKGVGRIKHPLLVGDQFGINVDSSEHGQREDEL
ncbi:putative UPF0481 protein At3g02645 [Momordica charantia]|uniref:UPF0481 protein At3g02645 n=1 Tax=Momordica charantia TaxID=3673 RepID=A0A6J1DUT7_MOMCH|nr:putative UPF0481 protein At3g02645 [Momordica charantia]